MLSVADNAYVHLEGTGTLGGTLLIADNAIVDVSLPFDAAANARPSVYFLNQLTTVGNGVLQLNAMVTVLGTNTLTNVELDGGALQGIGTFTVTYHMDWFGGDMTDAGSTIINGTLTIDSDTIHLADRTLTNNGTIDWISDNTIDTSRGAIVNNGLFKIEGDGYLKGSDIVITNTATGTIESDGSATLEGTFTNSNLINVVSGQLTLQGARFNNPGTVRILNATLVVAVNGESSGSFLGNRAQGQLEFKPQTSYTLTAASTVSMAGTVGFTRSRTIVSGSFLAISTVISNGTAVFTHDVTLLNGFLGGANGDLSSPANTTVTITGQFTWLQGTMDGGGTTVIAPTGALTLNSTDAATPMPELNLAPNPKFLGSATTRTLTNQGIISWLGGDLTVQRDSTLTNAASLYLYGNNTLTAYGDFINNGTVTKDLQPPPAADAADAYLYVFNQGNQGNEGVSTLSHVVNNGLINVNTGQLELVAGSSQGAINVTATAEVHFSTGTFRIQVPTDPNRRIALAGLQLTGAGTYYIDGGTLTVNANVSTANMQLSDGTLNGSGVLTITNEFVWSSGTMSGTGSTRIGDPSITYTRLNAPVLYVSLGFPNLARDLFIPGLVVWTNPNGITRPQVPTLRQIQNNHTGWDERPNPVTIETFKRQAGMVSWTGTFGSQTFPEYQGLVSTLATRLQTTEQNAYTLYQQGVAGLGTTLQQQIATAEATYAGVLANWQDPTAPGALDAIIQAEETRDASLTAATNKYVMGERSLYQQYIQTLSTARQTYYYGTGTDASTDGVMPLLRLYQRAFRVDPNLAYWGLRNPLQTAVVIRGRLLGGDTRWVNQLLSQLGPESRAALAQAYYDAWGVELSADIASRLWTLLGGNEAANRTLRLLFQSLSGDPLPPTPVQSIVSWVQSTAQQLNSLTLNDIDQALLNVQQRVNTTVEQAANATTQFVRDTAQQAVNDPIGFALAAGTAYLNTYAVGINTFTFGLIPQLDQYTARLRQQSPFYQVIYIGSLVGREIAIQAALGAVTGGVGNVIATGARNGRLAAELAQGVLCLATTAQRLTAPVQLGMQAYSFGVGANRAYNALRGGNFWTGAEQLTQSAMQLPSLYNSMRQTLQLFNAARQGREALTAYLAACFAAGTPILGEFGYKNIEEFKPGERVWARDENDVGAPLVLREIEECFSRTARIWHLHVGGQVIRTTGEHPFWVYGRGWVEANLLKPGDRLCSHDGQWIAVEEIFDTGEYETVYNFSVAEDHTYFVAGQAWGKSLWAHNARVCGSSETARAEYNRIFRLGRQPPVFQQVPLRNARIAFDNLPPQALQDIRIFERTMRNSSTFRSVARFRNNLVLQRSDLFGQPNIRTNVWQILNGRAPRVRGETVNLHHVGQSPRGPFAEITATQNRYDPITGGPLHIPGPSAVQHDAAWDAFRDAYWARRLQQAVEDGTVPRRLFERYLQDARRAGTLSSYFR